VLEILVNGGFVDLTLFGVGVALLFRSALIAALGKLDDCESWLLVALLTYTFTRLQISETITHGKLFFLLLGVAGARASVRRAPDDALGSAPQLQLSAT
jgi:hypothetical protein